MSENEKTSQASVKDSFRTRSRPDKFKVSFETADQEFAKFQHHYELYAEEIDGNELAAFLKVADKLIVAVQKGVLVFKEDGTVVQTLQNKVKVTYKPLTGMAKVQDHGLAKQGDSPEVSRVRRMHAMMGALSGLGYDAMQELEGVDLAVMECLAFLLLMV